MIAHVRGRVAALSDASAVVEVGGVGLAIALSHRTAALLSVGEDVLLHTHFQLREDGVSLYGFLTTVERQIFQLVIGVTGIGPKVAMSLLSAHTPAELVRAFLKRDAAALEHVPGIGKKTAQRLLVELQDKVAKLPEGTAECGPAAAGRGDELASAAEFLMQLGANRKEALAALEAVRQQDGADLPLNELIGKSLHLLGGRP